MGRGFTDEKGGPGKGGSGHAYVKTTKIHEWRRSDLFDKAGGKWPMLRSIS